MHTSRFRLPVLSVVAVALYAWLVAAPADALAQRNWVGSLTGDRKFSTSGNWDGGTPIATGDFLTFGAMVNVDGDLLNDLNGYSAGRLTFTGGYGFTLKGNPLTITEALIINRDGGEHSIQLDIGGKAETLVAANSRLHLSGNNTFSGRIDVYGDLYVESNAALGSTAGETTIEPGATLRLAGRDLAEPIRVFAGDDFTPCSVQAGDGTSVLRDIRFSGKACIYAPQEVNLPNGFGFSLPGAELLLAAGTFRAGGAVTGAGAVRPILGNVIWNATSTVDFVVSQFMDAIPEVNLSGSGSVGSLQFSRGQVSPGTESGPGRFSVAGPVSLDHTTVSFGLNGTTAGTGHSALQAGGPVTIGAETNLDLALYIGYTPTVGSQYRIIDNTGNQPISGTFKGLPEGANFFASGRPWSITYKGGTGNDVVVTALQPDARPFKRFVVLVAAGN